MWGTLIPMPLAIGIGMGVGMGIGMGVGNNLGSQGTPHELLIACPASSQTVESEVLRRARTRATAPESSGALGGCCAASPVAVRRKTASQRDIATSTETETVRGEKPGATEWDVSRAERLQRRRGLVSVIPSGS